MKKIGMIVFLSLFLVVSSCSFLDKKEEEKDLNINSGNTLSNEEEKAKNEAPKREVFYMDLLRSQDYDTLISLIKKKIDSWEKTEDNLFAYAQALAWKWNYSQEEQKYWKKALEIINEAIDLNNSNTELYRVRGYIYEILEDYEKAFDSYNKSIELDSNNAKAYSSLWHAYRLYGDYEKAIENLEKAYKINPDDEHTLLNLAYFSILDSDLEKASEYLKKAISVSKNKRFLSEAHNTLWSIYIYKWNSEEAYKEFVTSIKVDPSFEMWFINLAIYYIDDYKKSLKNNPKKKEDIKFKSLGNAIWALNEALKLNPKKSLTYKTFWDLYYLLWKKEKALKFYKEALNLIDKDITLWKKEKLSTRKKIENILKNFKK